MVVREALGRAAFSMRELAAEARLNYGTVRAWAMGRRVPDAKNINALADGLEQKALELVTLADELRKAAK